MSEATKLVTRVTNLFEKGLSSLSSLFEKTQNVLKNRPQRLWQYARGYALFGLTHLLAPFVFGNDRYQIGSNVRLQKISSLLASDPTSKIKIGGDTIIYEKARIEAYGDGVIDIGASSVLGDVLIYSRSRVRLGPRCLTSWNVLIQDFDPHPISQSLRAEQVRQMADQFLPRWSGKKDDFITPIEWNFPSEEISIGSDVWLGAGCTILKGSRIGDGCVVAAGAVVTGGDFPERSLIAGNPARAVKVLPQ